MFQVNDRVLIKPESSYYTENPYNPKDVKGTIIEIEDNTYMHHDYRVNWDNGRSNSYRESDLMLVNARVTPFVPLPNGTLVTINPASTLFIWRVGGSWNVFQTWEIKEYYVHENVYLVGPGEVLTATNVIPDNEVLTATNVIPVSEAIYSCIHCKQSMMKDTWAHVNPHEGVVCMPCKESHYFICEVSSRVIPNIYKADENTVMAINEVLGTNYVTISNNAVSELVFRCYRCNVYVSQEERPEIGHFCSTCVDLYYGCDECGEVYHQDELYDGVCSGCQEEHEEVAQEETDVPPPANTSLRFRERKFGVELECMADESEFQEDSTSFSKHSDGSISEAHGVGIEYVSTILGGNTGLSKVKTFLKRIQNTHEVDNSCGFHVHVDFHDRTKEKRQRLALTVYRMENWFYKVLAPSRDTNHYCKRLNRDDIMAVPEDDRYKGFNQCAIGKHGTIEYRYHSGTLNITKVQKWIKLCVHLTEIGSKRKHLPTNTKYKFKPSVKNMLRYLTVLKMDESDKHYFLGRYCHFQGLNYSEQCKLFNITESEVV